MFWSMEDPIDFTKLVFMNQENRNLWKFAVCSLQYMLNVSRNPIRQDVLYFFVEI